MNMANTTDNSTEDMLIKVHELKGTRKLKFYKNISKYYNEMKNRTFQFQEDPFAKKAQGISKIYHEVLLLMKLLQTKPQVKIMNTDYYNLYYTVIKTRDEKENVNNNEDDYLNFNDIVPNHYIGRKKDNVILR